MNLSGSTRSILPVACGREQAAEAIGRAQFKLRVHLDGFERANFDADLAAHADRNIDVEPRGINLRLAHVIRLLVLALLDVDALGRALFLADLAGHAAHPSFPIGAVVHQKWKDARVFSRRYPLLRILDRRQPFFRDKAAGKILCRLRQPLSVCLHPAKTASKFLVHSS